MGHLLSMMLVACDRRRNPVAGLVSSCASQTYDSVVQLLGKVGSTVGPPGVNYTIKRRMMLGYDNRPPARAVTASGETVSVPFVTEYV